MRTAYKCRAYPDPEQASVLNRTFGCVRVAWNRTLAWRQARYRDGQAPTSYAQASAYLTAMKAEADLGWLNEVSSVPLQQAVRHQQAAFSSFLAGRAGYPRYKSRSGRQCAEYTRSGFRFPATGSGSSPRSGTPVAFAWSWPDIDLESLDPTTVTVSRDPCGRWYISLAVDVPEPKRRSPRQALSSASTWASRTSPPPLTRQKIPGTRGAWPGATNADLARYQRRLAPLPAGLEPRRTGPRLEARRSPAPTARSARLGPTSCTAPPPGWSATTT